jgi:hypothetical protein
MITIVEWDGDRSSAAGGFDIHIVSREYNLKHQGRSYCTNDDRIKALNEIRATADKMAKDLNMEIKESIYS